MKDKNAEFKLTMGLSAVGCIVFIYLLGYSLQDVSETSTITGVVDSYEIKKSRYVAYVYLNSSNLEFIIRVPKNEHALLNQIFPGDEIEISYLKPFFNKSAVVAVRSLKYEIPPSSLIEIYKEDQLPHFLIVLVFGILATILFLYYFLFLRRKR